MAISKDIYDAVAPVALSQGVPNYIWKSIVLMESSGDPRSTLITDKEASYGLFQLNTKGGQGAAYADNPEALYDPYLNATIAMPAIATAYREGVAKGYDAADLAAYTAANSGHPGYGLSLDYPAVKKVWKFAADLIGQPSDPSAETPKDTPSDPGTPAATSTSSTGSATAADSSWWSWLDDIWPSFKGNLASLVVDVLILIVGLVLVVMGLKNIATQGGGS